MSGSPTVGSTRDMWKRDSHFWWRPGRVYIPAWQFSGLDYEATTATDIKSMGTGAANDTSIAEINTSGITAVNMTANANSLEHLMALPYDIDLSKNIYFRVYWTANNTSGSVTWDVLYKAITPNSTVLGSAVSATALTRTIGAHTMAGVAYTIMRTPEGVLIGNTLADSVEMLQLGVVRTTATTITTASFLGLEIRYTPHRLYYGGMVHEAKAPAYIASDKYLNT